MNGSEVCTPSNRNAARYKKYKTARVSSYSQTGAPARKRRAPSWSGSSNWGKSDRQAEVQKQTREKLSPARCRDWLACSKRRMWERMTVGRRQVRKCKEKNTEAGEEETQQKEANLQSKTDPGSRERPTQGRETSLGTIGQPATLGEQQATCKVDYSESDRHWTLGRDEVCEEAHGEGMVPRESEVTGPQSSADLYDPLGPGRECCLFSYVHSCLLRVFSP